MPLSAELDKLLSYIPEAEREASRKRITELYENGLRQEEFSRKLNENTAAHKKNIEWYNKAKSEYDAALAELNEANKKIASLESQRQQPPPSNDNTDDDFGQLDPEVSKALKVARQEAETAKAEVANLTGRLTEIDKMIKEGKVVTQDVFNQEINKRGDALGAAVLDIWDLQQEHITEFGKPLDRGKLLEKAAADHQGNLRAAYKELTEEMRTEKLREQIRAEEERKAEDKFKNSSLPYAPGNDTTMGPLQKLVLKKKEDTGIPDDVPADGSGRLASLIAQELKQEGKF